MEFFSFLYIKKLNRVMHFFVLKKSCFSRTHRVDNLLYTFQSLLFIYILYLVCNWEMEHFVRIHFCMREKKVITLSKSNLSDSEAVITCFKVLAISQNREICKCCAFGVSFLDRAIVRTEIPFHLLFFFQYENIEFLRLHSNGYDYGAFAP